MYIGIYALYIGVVATLMSYLYLRAAPYYAQQISQGAEADESLWWRAVCDGRCISYNTSMMPPYALLAYALSFGLVLSVCVLYKPWLPQASLWLNISVMTLWLGGLILLARIDRLCFLLPDVITQLLLWLGLALAVQLNRATDFSAMSAFYSVIGVYIMGRSLNYVAYRFNGRFLFGHGDVKFVAAVAAWLGAAALLPLLFVACMICMPLEAIRQRRWRPRGACAFGPYLVIATLGVWLCLK